MKENFEFLKRARRVRDKVAAKYLEHPGVSLIDIGYTYKEGIRTAQIAVRVHVQKKWLAAGKHKQIRFPDQIDGVPVIVISGNYQLNNKK